MVEDAELTLLGLELLEPSRLIELRGFVALKEFVEVTRVLSSWMILSSWVDSLSGVTYMTFPLTGHRTDKRDEWSPRRNVRPVPSTHPKTFVVISTGKPNQFNVVRFLVAESVKRTAAPARPPHSLHRAPFSGLHAKWLRQRPP